ncbi:MAG TPA: DinB family protein [Candidatus Limnocylindrales bacterium]|nr:DinB family protein [Candidatus Limnocylindrales bacterium]
MPAGLEHVLRHNAWANRALLEHCAALGADALELKAAGTYGSLYGTLQHLVGGEQFYIWLLTNEMLGKRIRKTERHSLGDLSAIAAMTGARAIDLAASEDPDRVIGDHAGDDWTTAGIVLAQLVNHGNEHRAHAATILGANGLTAPKIGAWTYGIANGISKNDGD